MAKKKREEPRREVTKRQLSQWQKQKRRQRIILGAGIFIVAAVLGIVGTGIYNQWYIAEYKPLHQTVVSVNDTEFDMDYYVKMLKFYGEGQPATFIYELVNEVGTIIERNELIRQETLVLGFSVSDKEVDEELKNHDPPFNDVHRDIIRSQLLLRKLHDEYFEHKVPMSAEQRHIRAMFLESESQVTEVSARLEAGEMFADLAGELSLEGLTKTEEGDLDWRPEGALTILLNTIVPDEYAFTGEVDVLSQPIYDEAKFKAVGYWIIKVPERKEESEQARVQVILLGSKEEAQNVSTRLGAGEDFAALAQELSRHDVSKENGGDLGWLTPGMTSSAIDEFVFNAELELSEPIRDESAGTRGGYWLIKVLGIDDNRHIEDEDRELLKEKALSEWVSALRDNPGNRVENYLDDEMKEWAIGRAIGS